MEPGMLLLRWRLFWTAYAIAHPPRLPHVLQWQVVEAPDRALEVLVVAPDAPDPAATLSLIRARFNALSGPRVPVNVCLAYAVVRTSSGKVRNVVSQRTRNRFGV